ncbi:hypothetical protein J2741_001705 [Methanolinea mesophila]|uniref:hypothetical protein n=1 Tax=Methanolinea mesophila TaxID=547055 RepID=UPI001AE66967|nr:hypothetical protein [Methanolinea mesophila]MBP1929158.1 hypothetical protein [Methanolinea mesophila]
MKILLRNYEGWGLFTLKEGKPLKIISYFHLHFFSNGSAEIQCDLSKAHTRILQDFSSPNFTYFSMIGIIEDSEYFITIDELATIELNKLLVSSSIILRSKYGDFDAGIARNGITNLEFFGCYYRKKDDKAVLDTVDLKFEDFVLQIQRINNYDHVIKEIKNSQIANVTAEIIVPVTLGNRESREELIEDITHLLSFAVSNEVLVIYRDYYLSNGDIFFTELLCRHDVNFSNSIPILPINHPIPCNLEEFLKHSIPRYHEYRDNLDLNALIYFVINANSPLIALELKFLISFTGIETFCSDFESLGQGVIPRRSIERNEKIIQQFFDKKKIKIEESVMKELAIKVAFPHPDLKDKMRLALSAFSIPFDDDDMNLVSIRNEIVHNGQFKSEKNPLELTFRAQNLLIRILLSVLNYHGKYIKRSIGYRQIEFP